MPGNSWSCADSHETVTCNSLKLNRCKDQLTDLLNTYWFYFCSNSIVQVCQLAHFPANTKHTKSFRKITKNTTLDRRFQPLQKYDDHLYHVNVMEARIK